MCLIKACSMMKTLQWFPLKIWTVFLQVDTIRLPLLLLPYSNVLPSVSLRTPVAKEMGLSERKFSWGTAVRRLHLSTHTMCWHQLSWGFSLCQIWSPSASTCCKFSSASIARSLALQTTGSLLSAKKNWFSFTGHDICEFFTVITFAQMNSWKSEAKSSNQINQINGNTEKKEAKPNPANCTEPPSSSACSLGTTLHPVQTTGILWTSNERLFFWEFLHVDCWGPSRVLTLTLCLRKPCHIHGFSMLKAPSEHVQCFLFGCYITTHPKHIKMLTI